MDRRQFTGQLAFGADKVVPMRAGGTIAWRMKDR